MWICVKIDMENGKRVYAHANSHTLWPGKTCLKTKENRQMEKLLGN